MTCLSMLCNDAPFFRLFLLRNFSLLLFHSIPFHTVKCLVDSLVKSQDSFSISISQSYTSMPGHQHPQEQQRHRGGTYDRK